MNLKNFSYASYRELNPLSMATKISFEILLHDEIKGAIKTENLKNNKI